MVKNIFPCYCIILASLLFSSCGVILDEVKIKDSWKLQRVEYYVYQDAFDSYKTYDVSNGEDTSTDNVPYFGAFFGVSTLEASFILDFSEKDFTVEQDKTTAIVDAVNSSWSMNSVTNTMTLTVTGTNSGSNNIWIRGFEIENDWPMSDNDSLEIYIRAEDISRDSIKVLYWNGTEDRYMGVDAMRAFFVRYSS